MIRLLALLPVAMLLAAPATASAAPSYATTVTPFSSMPHMGVSAATRRGVGVMTGSIGSTEITSLPGSGGEGLLMNNGNGTSTFLGGDRLPQTVATPQ
ncbi:MAG: hypothetical protein WDN25_29340 [Acetobacteraceae bacterium]